MNDHDWTGHLEPDERILWQGKPVRQIPWRWAYLFWALVGLLVYLFGTYLYYLTAEIGLKAQLAALGIAALGPALAAMLPMIEARRMRKTEYALSNKRAFITRNPLIGRRKCTPYDINPETEISSDDLNPTTIIFATKERIVSNGYVIDQIGFERIKDGHAVLSMLTRMQSHAE